MKTNVVRGYVADVLGWEGFCVVSRTGHCFDEIDNFWLWGPLLHFLW